MNNDENNPNPENRSQLTLIDGGRRAQEEELLKLLLDGPYKRDKRRLEEIMNHLDDLQSVKAEISIVAEDK